MAFQVVTRVIKWELSRPGVRWCRPKVQRRSKRVVMVRLNEEAKWVVRLYSALLSLTLLHETTFTRPFVSFQLSRPSLVIRFDGCLGGAGVIWYGGDAATALSLDPFTRGLPALGGVAVDLRSLGFGEDSSFQNVSEFISLLIGVVGAVVMGWDVSSVFFIGDSQTALTWAREGRFRSSNVRQAASAMTMIGATRNFNVRGVHHVPKEDNHACDILSRRGHSEAWDSLVQRMVGQTGDVVLGDLREAQLPGVDTLLSLCVPRVGGCDESDFATHWRSVWSWVTSLFL